MRVDTRKLQKISGPEGSGKSVYHQNTYWDRETKKEENFYFIVNDEILVRGKSFRDIEDIICGDNPRCPACGKLGYSTAAINKHKGIHRGEYSNFGILDSAFYIQEKILTMDEALKNIEQYKAQEEQSEIVDEIPDSCYNGGKKIRKLIL